jgi:hypothetical protein
MSDKQPPPAEHEQQPTRREVLKKAAYIAPAILTLTAVPSFAAKGSGWGKQRADNGKHLGWGKKNKNK